MIFRVQRTPMVHSNPWGMVTWSFQSKLVVRFNPSLGRAVIVETGDGHGRSAIWGGRRSSRILRFQMNFVILTGVVFDFIGQDVVRCMVETIPRHWWGLTASTSILYCWNPSCRYGIPITMSIQSPTSHSLRSYTSTRFLAVFQGLRRLLGNIFLLQRCPLHPIHTTHWSPHWTKHSVDCLGPPISNFYSVTLCLR